MTLPEFTAEASLYKSSVTYHLDSTLEKTLLSGVILSRRGDDEDTLELLCEKYCYRNFRGNTYLLSECLSNC